MACINKKTSLVGKIFCLKNNYSELLYFLITDYDKKKDEYSIIECYSDGSIKTNGIQATILASKVKKLDFVNELPSKQLYNETKPYDDSDLMENSFIKESTIKKIEDPKEDPIILLWKRMKLLYSDFVEI